MRINYLDEIKKAHEHNRKMFTEVRYALEKLVWAANNIEHPEHIFRLREEASKALNDNKWEHYMPLDMEIK